MHEGGLSWRDVAAATESDTCAASYDTDALIRLLCTCAQGIESICSETPRDNDSKPMKRLHHNMHQEEAERYY